jgi:hypothetical protein
VAAPETQRAAAVTQPGECAAVGPVVRESADELRPARCNRMAGHEQADVNEPQIHIEMRRDSRRVLAKWTTP